MFRKIAVFALLLAVALASFPTSGVLAKDAIADKLEKKWDQLVESYKTQNFNHTNAHKVVENYLKTHKNIKAADKAELERHLAICNSSLDEAKSIVDNHPGFDAKGNVIDRAVARTTLQKLANYLQQHKGSVKNLNEQEAR
jgi:hypothetical protein